MPITQDRMIDLIREVERCSHAREQLVTDLRQTIQLWSEQLFTPTEAMDSIVLLLNQQHELSLPAYHTEKAHFLKHEARNEKKQRYAAGQRRMAGVPQAQSLKRDFAKPPRHQAIGTSELPEHYRATLAQMEQQEFAAKTTAPIDYSTPPTTSSGWKPMPAEATRKRSDAIPDLSEYQPDPPDFKDGIF